MMQFKDLKNINFKSKNQLRKEKSRNLALGVIIGAAVGTVLGAFSQTDQGKKATKQVVNSAKDLKDKSKVALFNSMDKIKDKKDLLKERLHKNKVQEAVNDNE